ncbi:Carboxypeptidase A4 [Entomortierella chlamydospora]|nr:Carboxypeptidase A4 [Entomortierella chlamydospora]
MHQFWTTACLALSCAVLTLAYPQPQPQQSELSWHGLQQHPFGPLHRASHHRNSGSNEDDIDTYARFDQDKVFRVEVSSLEQLKSLEAIVETLNLDLWSNLRVGTVDVRVTASMVTVFEAATRHIPSTVMIPNLQDLIPMQAPATLLHNTQSDWNFTDNSFWLNYHDLATLNNFTESMVQQFPDLVKRVSIGQTHEGREVFGMSIHGYKSNKDDMDEVIDDSEQDQNQSLWSWLFGYSKHTRKPSKPKKHPKAVLLHAGQHAREWIGPAVVTYIAKELILGYHHNKKITKLVDQFEFVIVPVLNADGYAFTWEKNRMWRKNRQPTSIPFCVGIDPNRNWGYKWNTGGSSDNPCNEGYHGPEAFAALEPKMMSEFILKRKNVVAYIDFHAYSQLWMSPFGGDCKKVPKDDEDLIEGGMGAAKALHGVHGKKFVVGNICDVIYQASGGSIDWTYAEGKVKYSYGVELRDTGRYGFLLPESEILPSSEETTAAVVYLANFIRKREKQWGYMV